MENDVVDDQIMSTGVIDAEMTVISTNLGLSSITGSSVDTAFSVISDCPNDLGSSSIVSIAAPSARRNAMVAVIDNTLFLYGGVVESRDAECTLGDMYALTRGIFRTVDVENGTLLCILVKDI